MAIQRLLLGASLGLLVPPVIAGSDHDLARRALQSGEVKPLDQILAAVAKQHPGQVLEVELESRSRGLIYEIKILSPQGSMIKLKVDAKTGEVLEHRSRTKN
ncbi:MAG: peptidase [Burkholderiaceae bacterium]|nr:peptidase [Burkholderiaceae bacterium]